MSTLKVGPDVRNCVKPAKMNNPCTLEQIDAIVVDFFAFAEKVVFFLPAANVVVCGIYSNMFDL
jgi:hypothetical protein